MERKKGKKGRYHNMHRKEGRRVVVVVVWRKDGAQRQAQMVGVQVGVEALRSG